MSRKFAERVQAEREALRCVNQHYPNEKLHGLSSRAIAIWDNSIDWANFNCNRKHVLEKLYHIGILCQALADQSRSAFDPGAFDLVTILEEVTALRKMLGNIQDK